MQHNQNIYLLFLALLAFLNMQCATSKTISGTITDCEGEAIAGVSIYAEKGIGTVTNFDGHYELTVPKKNTVLTFKAIGFLPKEIKIGKQKTLNVSLQEKNMNEQITVKKPVIYLYPPSKTEVKLKLHYAGELLFTYPKYENGWEVTAYPDGTLENKKDGKTYSYLFWDGKKTYDEKTTTYDNGFVIHKDSIVSFLQEQLSQYGLQPKEYNDFIVFWTPYLAQSEWNFVHFRMGKSYAVISENEVTPKPDTTLRIFMDFKKIASPLEISPQKIIKTERKGFTLVEWGGAEVKQPIKIKTKSGRYIEQ